MSVRRIIERANNKLRLLEVAELVAAIGYWDSVKEDNNAWDAFLQELQARDAEALKLLDETRPAGEEWLTYDKDGGVWRWITDGANAFHCLSEERTLNQKEMREMHPLRVGYGHYPNKLNAMREQWRQIQYAEVEKKSERLQQQARQLEERKAKRAKRHFVHRSGSV